MTAGMEVVSPLQYNDIDRICRTAKSIVVECSGCRRVVSGRRVHLPMIAYGFWCSRCCPCQTFIPSRQEEDVIELRMMKGDGLDAGERRFVVIEPVLKAPVVNKQSGEDAAKVQEKLAKERIARAEAKRQRAKAKAERLKAKAAKKALMRIAHKAADKLLDDRRYLNRMPDFAHLGPDAALIARKHFVTMRRLWKASQSGRIAPPVQRSEETKRRMAEAATRRWAKLRAGQ